MGLFSLQMLHTTGARAQAAASASKSSIPKAAAEPAAPGGADRLPQTPSDPALEVGAETTSVDADAKARARALYEKGARAYSDAKFLPAAELFLETHRIFPTPQLLFNIAKAYDKAGSVSAALSYYRDYLRNVDDAPDEAEVEERVRELERILAERGVQQISVISDPEAATVLLDGRPVGITPFTGETWPGKHRVEVRLSGHRDADQVVEIEPHRSGEAKFKLAPIPVQAPPKPPPAPASVAKAAEVTPLTWIVLGGGTLGLTSALFAEMANRDREGITRTGAFLAGLGIAASAVGGVLLYLDLNPGNRTDKAQVLSLELRAEGQASLRYRF